MVLTGYNTDIEHAGTVYHVQTEDKGRANPFVESLVYAKGEILYSRRTSYHDLVEEGVEQKTIASLLERQHRAIVEAIRRGRLSDLTTDLEEGATEDDTTITRVQEDVVEMEEGAERSLDQVILDYLEAQRGKAHLVLQATGDHDFVYGEVSVVKVTAVDSQANAGQTGVEVSVLFKSTADPRRVVLAEGETGETGEYSAEVELPPFNGGTSAVVITARSNLGNSEIKHLVHR